MGTEFEDQIHRVLTLYYKAVFYRSPCEHHVTEFGGYLVRSKVTA